MWNSGATHRWVGVDGVVRALRMSGRSGAMRHAAIAMVALLAGVFAAPVVAQSTTVSITGANRPSFSRAGQPLTFYVQLSAGNAEIAGLSFTSGSPSGMSAVSCPSLPVAVNATTTCTFTYTTTDMDVAMGKVTALGRWRATRTGAAARSGSTNTVELGYAPPRAPDAPTVVTATASDGKAVVNFAAPFDGGYPIDDYTVTSQPDGITATGANGPITVSGLTNGVTYRFAITARSTMGASAASASSNAVTPKAVQSIDFQNPGAQNFGTSPTLTATATSNLAVAFSSGTTSICTITAGGTLTFLSAGTCTIHADQAGDTVYDPAPRVSQSFVVNAILPDAPTIGTATAGDAEATVAFTAPASNGGSAITNYTVTANPGGNTATGNASPIRVAGLTNFVAYTFTVTAENTAGTGPASAASNSVVPNTAPQVTSVAVPANGLYGPGQNLDFTVTWDQDVAIAGTPQIAVTIGTTTVQARYLASPTASTALFRYTVLAGQMDANGILVGTLSLNGGSIANGYGTPAQLTLNSMGSTTGVLVGTNNQAPVNTVPGARSVTENDTLNFGNTISIDDADAGSAQVQVTLTVSNGVLSLTSPAGLTFAVGDGSNDATMTFSGTLANINAALDGLRFTPTTGYYGPASLQITTNDLGNTGFGGAKTDTDNVAITVVPLDNTPPVVSAIALVDASPTNATTVAFDVTFSEPVIGVTVSDFTLVGTNGTTGSAAGLVTSDNIRYRITVTGVSGSGTLRLNLNANTGITDAAGNAAPGYNAGPAYSIDQAGAQIDSVATPAAGQYIAGQTLTFQVTFDENVTVTGTPSLPLTLDVGGAREATYVSGSGTTTLTFNYTVAAGDQDLDGPVVGTAVVSNGGTIADVAGNAALLTLNNVGNTSGIVVGQLAQAITGFAATPTTPTFAPNGTFTVAATGGASGLPVVFASTTASVCTVAGNAVTMLAAGTCSLTADQAGNANYSAAPRVTLDVTIAAASQAITSFAANPVAPVYSPNGTFTVSATPGVSTSAVVYGSTTPQVCAIAGNVVTMLAAGTCSLTADQAGDANHNAAPRVLLDVTIGAAPQAITGFASTPAAPTFAPNGTFAIAATGGASGAPVLFASAAPSVCSVAGTTVTMLSAGTCSLTANQAGSANYSAAPQATLDVAIATAGQAITGFAAHPVTPVYAPNGTFTVSATPGVSTSAVVFGTTTASVCTVAGNVVTMVAAGTCSLTADQAGDSNYNAAPRVTLDVAIGAATQAITGFAANPAAPVYAPNGMFSVTATGGASGLPVTYTSTTAATCSVAGSTVTMLAAGTCSLTADQAGNANYSAAPRVTLDIAIGAATQAITNFVAKPPAPVLAPNGMFTVSATPGVSTSAVVFGSTTTSVCTINGSTVTMLSAGTCSLTADQAGDGNYNAAPQLTLDVAISAATQVITGFTATPSAPVFAPNGTFALAAVGGASGNPVTFASTTQAVCTVAGNVVTMKAAGTCALTADQAGSNDYVAAPQVALQVVIGRATPTLSWLGEMSRVVGEAAFDLPDPGSDSRGAFTFTSSNPAVATVSGRRVTIVGAGVTTLVATQAADGNYAQGTVSATLTVTDRPDPTKDASVAGGLQAQVDASVRFAAAQLSNIQGRLREQRFATANHSRNDLTFAMASRSGGAVSMSAEQFASMDTAHLPTGLAVWSAGAITSGGRDEGDSDFQSDGVTVGADWRFNDRLLFGVAGGWGWDDTDLDDARSRLDAQQRAVSMYGLWRPTQRWFVDGIVGWGELDFDIRRHSDVADATATATRSGDQAFGSLTAGYEHGGGIGMTLTGYGRLDASRTTLDAYREQGLGIYDLAYGSQTVENSGASLGVEGSFPILTPRGSAFRPYWMLEYRETLENRSDVELNYVVLPVDGGYVLGMRGYGDNALTYGGGIDMELARGWKLSLLGRRQHADGQRPSSTFGLLLSFSPAAASAANFRDDAVDAAQPQDAAKP